MWGVPVPHAMLLASLSEDKYSPVLCRQGQGLLFNMGFHPIPHIRPNERRERWASARHPGSRSRPPQEPANYPFPSNGGWGFAPCSLLVFPFLRRNPGSPCTISARTCLLSRVMGYGALPHDYLLPLTFLCQLPCSLAPLLWASRAYPLPRKYPPSIPSVLKIRSSMSVARGSRS